MNLFKAAVFVLVLGLSFYLITTQDIKILSDQSLFAKLVLVFVAGLFYTSFLTSPLAVVMFVILAGSTNIYLLTIIGGAGAVLGDLFIVKFIRLIFRSFSFVKHIGSFKIFKKKLSEYHLDVISYLLGLVIVASPFPDELGLVLLGASRLSYFQLAILTFILNSIGILIILYTTRALL